MIKAIVYGKSTGNYKHWDYNELAGYLDFANNLVLKGNKRLKPKDLENTLFGCFGDSQSDALRLLKLFKLEHVNRKLQYLDFEINHDLVYRTFCVFQATLNTFSNILSKKNELTKQNLGNLLDAIIMKYI